MTIKICFAGERIKCTVPRNKRTQAREEKRDEIVEAARRLFVEQGYEATAISSVAQAAGVTGNTIYWYFKDKDAVLIAVLERLFAEASAEYRAIAGRPTVELLLWVVDRLQQVSGLVATVHARVEHSPELHTWHDGFHRMAEGSLRQAIQHAGVDALLIDAEVKIGVFAIEGMLTHDLSDVEQQTICAALAARWET